METSIQLFLITNCFGPVQSDSVVFRLDTIVPSSLLASKVIKMYRRYYRLPVDEDTELFTPDQTIVSVASSLPASVQYDDNTLRAELLRLGFTPGPIQDTTRNLYLKKLQALKKGPRRSRESRDNVDGLSSNLRGLAINNKQKKSEYYFLFHVF